MIRILTTQNPVVLNKKVIAGEQYSYTETTPTQSGNAGAFGYNAPTSGQPYGVLANQGNQGGFTDLAASISKMTSGEQGSGGQQGGSNPMDIVSTLAPLANQILQKRPLSEVESVCGKQPNFLASKSKKEAWQNCAINYSKSKVQPIQKQGENEPTKMSTTTKVLLGVGGAALLGTIIYLATRKK